MTNKKRHKRKVFFIKNRGLSTIVVTLIIVLLALVAIGILWGVIGNFIEKQSELTKIQNQFFSEQMNIMSVKYNEPLLNISIRKPIGEVVTSSINITSTYVPIEKDIISVVDLSQSMMPECSNVTNSQCNSLGGTYSSSTRICSYLQESRQSLCISYGGIWDDKLTATQDANSQLISKVLVGSEINKIGLVAYRDSVVDSMSVQLTNDPILLNSTIASWQATSTTCICCGINKAVEELTGQSSDETMKSIIVMSDGEANVRCSQQGTGDAKKDAIKAACDANSSLKNFGIWTIGVGNADESTLTNISVCGGGEYFSVSNTSELINTYQAIAQQIDTKYQSLTSFAYLSVIFYNATDSYKENIYDLPDILETKTYSFNLQGEISGKITRIEIYPVILTSNGKEVIGSVLDTWTAPY